MSIGWNMTTRLELESLIKSKSAIFMTCALVNQSTKQNHILDWILLFQLHIHFILLIAGSYRKLVGKKLVLHHTTSEPLLIWTCFSCMCDKAILKVTFNCKNVYSKIWFSGKSKSYNLIIYMHWESHMCYMLVSVDRSSPALVLACKDPPLGPSYIYTICLVWIGGTTGKFFRNKYIQACMLVMIWSKIKAKGFGP